MAEEPLHISREQQEELGTTLGKAYLAGGAEFGDMVMDAYKLGRTHGREPVQVDAGQWYYLRVCPELFKRLAPVLQQWLSEHHPQPFWVDNIPVSDIPWLGPTGQVRAGSRSQPGSMGLPADESVVPPAAPQDTS